MTELLKSIWFKSGRPKPIRPKPIRLEPVWTALRDFVIEFDAMMHHATHGRPLTDRNENRRRKR
ncbi:hypothetical protein NA8A_04540 [Nitratireductor indicus C115]|uniref:Uncharacterized protein n=1 Tax=Nitratireductor indicus C115 TaxID=1231190 RepID=K2NXX0_9HYPH|nr:hypothetical protein [Nitratireductor indicus]EKF44050.1 hypothetical protein NA8A_04540 [Nitratireductor indicus C115]SFQ11297.1 hypothetical protein SAMN05216176_101401 [Nitratireductor indicus]